MNINISDYEMLGGSYGIILVDRKNGKVLKLFKSYNHPDLNGTGKEGIGEIETNECRKKVFITEAEAYEKAQESSMLKIFSPNYFGRVETEKIYDGEKDVTDLFLKDCCFEIEFIDGTDIKIAEMKGSQELKNLEKKLSFTLNDLIDEFNKRGIGYTKDSSVIFTDDKFKVIDFATIDCENFKPIAKPKGDDPYGNIKRN